MNILQLFTGHRLIRNRNNFACLRRLCQPSNGSTTLSAVRRVRSLSQTPALSDVTWWKCHTTEITAEGSNCRSLHNSVDKNMEQNEGTAGQETLAEERVDMGIPNEGWTEESKQLFDELLKLTESKEWLKHKSFAKGSRSKALFSRTPSVGRPGQIFEYAFFINSTEKLLKGVIQFGPQTEGPPGHAHGGSIATMIDAACGVLVYVTLPGARVTANMNIDYRRPTPLMKTMSIEAQVGEVIRRKTYVKCKLSSADGENLHAEATVLFVSIDPSIITK